MHRGPERGDPPRRRAGEALAPAEADDLRSLAAALAIERMIRDGVASEMWPQEPPWSAPSA